MSRKKRVVYDVDENVIKENVQKWPEEIRGQIEAFALTFNRLLMERQIDQQKMAAETGISVGAISHYRNGIGNPSLDKLRTIAEYLGVDCNYLITGVRAEHHEISEYTGLSENAITCLHALQTEKPTIMNQEYAAAAINKILESEGDKGVMLLSAIAEYLELCPTKYDLIIRNKDATIELKDCDITAMSMVDIQDILHEIKMYDHIVYRETLKETGRD